jgi:hypothetical protein
MIDWLEKGIFQFLFIGLLHELLKHLIANGLCLPMQFLYHPLMSCIAPGFFSIDLSLVIRAFIELQVIFFEELTRHLKIFKFDFVSITCPYFVILR